MNYEKNSKQSELLIILVSVIIIAFLVSFLSNIIFTAFFEKMPILLSIFCIIFLTLTSTFLYFIVASNIKSSAIMITFPFAFNKKNKRFIDLPYCPMSVHSRVCFDKLPDKGRDHLSCYDTPLDFFGSELERFIDHVIQESLLTIVFNQTQFDRNKYIGISYSKLPLGIKENNQFKIFMENFSFYTLALPFGEKVETYGRNNSFLALKSSYGRLKLHWFISYAQGAWLSEYFVDTSSKKDYHEYVIDLYASYECNVWKMLSKKMGIFIEYTTDIENKLKELDWKSFQLERVCSGINKKLDKLFLTTRPITPEQK